MLVYDHNFSGSPSVTALHIVLLLLYFAQMAWLVIGLDQVMTIIPTEHAVNTVSNLTRFLTS